MNENKRQKSSCLCSITEIRPFPDAKGDKKCSSQTLPMQYSLVLEAMGLWNNRMMNMWKCGAKSGEDEQRAVLVLSRRVSS
jgi:hypothetical protein